MLAWAKARPHLQNNQRATVMAHVAECLLSKHKAELKTKYCQKKKKSQKTKKYLLTLYFHNFLDLSLYLLYSLVPLPWNS
jgi:hypothetical protein